VIGYIRMSTSRVGPAIGTILSRWLTGTIRLADPALERLPALPDLRDAVAAAVQPGADVGE